jgi:hypothetical protein
VSKCNNQGFRSTVNSSSFDFVNDLPANVVSAELAIGMNPDGAAFIDGSAIDSELLVAFKVG